MATSIFRVGGGYTSLVFGGTNIAYVTTTQDSAPSTNGNPTAVQSIDQQYVQEIAIPNTQGMGTLTFDITEQWEQEVWQALPNFGNALDLIEVLQANFATGALTLVKVITPPAGSGGSSRSITYTGCVVTNVAQGETVAYNTMTLTKTVTVMYTKRQ